MVVHAVSTVHYGSENRQAKFRALSIVYNFVIGGYSLRIIVYIYNVPIFFHRIAPVNVHHLRTQFPTRCSKRNNCAVLQFESGSFWYINVHCIN